MDTVPTSVIECVRHGVAPREQEGMDWCASADCEQCEEAVWSELLRERDRLKAERDRALAELDKALGEREDAMLSERNAAYNAGYDEGFASADDWLAQHEDAMAEHGWVRLPHDRNGKLIRVGDEVMDVSDKWRNTFEVNGFLLNFDYEWSVCGEDMDAEPKNLVHYHAPTVDSVLRQFLGEMQANESDPHRTLAEYAAKLRLAGDAE